MENLKSLDKLIRNLDAANNKLAKVTKKRDDYIRTINELFLEKVKLYLELHPRAFFGVSYKQEIYRVEKGEIFYVFFFRDKDSRRYLFSVKIDEIDLKASLEEYKQVLLDKEKEERYNQYLELKKEFNESN